jgi:hypothetical protein
VTLKVLISETNALLERPDIAQEPINVHRCSRSLGNVSKFFVTVNANAARRFRLRQSRIRIDA